MKKMKNHKIIFVVFFVFSCFSTRGLLMQLPVFENDDVGSRMWISGEDALAERQNSADFLKMTQHAHENLDEHQLTPHSDIDFHTHFISTMTEDEAAKLDNTSFGLLMKHLVKHGYDRRLRPHLYGPPVFVSCSMLVGSIRSAETMDFTMDFYLRQSWDDYRLFRDPLDHSHENIAGAYNEILWQPDTYFVNTKVSKMHQVTRTNAFVRVSPHGHVHLSTRISVKAYCHMDFRFFPLDRQLCWFGFESYSLEATDIVYGWMQTRNMEAFLEHNHDPSTSKIRNAIDFGKDVNTGTLSAYAFRISETFAISHDGKNHSRLVVYLLFHRNFGHWLVQVYLPAALMVVCSWVSFWLPRDCEPARVTLGVTAILALITLRQYSKDLPKLSYLTAIDFYMITCLTLCSLEFILVSLAMAPTNFLSSENKANKREMDERSPGAITRHFIEQNRLRARSDNASRFIFPAFFVMYNILYWHYYLVNEMVTEGTQSGYFLI